ncbi:MAG: TIGR04282 family arsenosugar biosynthesis glycosyltransferase [Imperialibacter sp.]|uniref:TIGR04282 family arsenosugar biosynthesis glycosyltransferase n=1 Tax=Imperialibacter sp. TaxID=2038411 RepID=UPI0032ED2746
MTKEALIIFVKNAELGKVKTRLAKDIGDEKALDVYLELLQHTKDITADLSQDKYVFYSSFIPEDDIFSNSGYILKQQNGDDLGERMSNAFEEVLGLGYERAAIIGSDCLELETLYIEKAFECLAFRDFIIGPARDGGYYLLGMKTFDSGIFKGIEWSTSSVYKKTTDYIESQNKDFHKLPPLSDVDTIDDLGRLKTLIIE